MGLTDAFFGDDEFRVELDCQQRLIRIVGELDCATTPVFDNASAKLYSTGPGLVWLDFEKVTFCGAAGLGSVVRIHNRQRAAGERLSLTDIPPFVERVFRAGGLESLLLLSGSKARRIAVS